MENSAPGLPFKPLSEDKEFACENRTISDMNRASLTDIVNDPKSNLTYSWDVSESPNVCLRQCALEEFVLRSIIDGGLPPHVYNGLKQYFWVHLSERFKRVIFNRLVLNNEGFYTISSEPINDCPASRTEIWN